MYHKPRGLMTTHADPEGRPTVFDNLPEGLPRLISRSGRLDFSTEGLLFADQRWRAGARSNCPTPDGCGAIAFVPLTRSRRRSSTS
jgi:hypothetical protein